MKRSYDTIQQAADTLSCAIERPDQYIAQGDCEMISEGVRGRLTISGHERGNTVWRGFGSATASSSIIFNGQNNAVFLGAFTKLRKTDLRFIGDNCLFFFGPLSTVVSMVSILRGEKNIMIGSECMFSGGISIDTSDHHGIYAMGDGARLNLDADVTIASRVWLGRSVTVAKGASIASDTVIGAGSFARGDIAANSVYAGTPAKQIRSGVVWSRGAAENLASAEDTAIMRPIIKKRRHYEARLREGNSE